MSKDYLLGIDIGTSACKVAIFNKNGKVMASANGDYPVYYPHEGWAQQKPDEWWHAVCGAICECLETGNISGEQIAGVGIDGQSWSAIAIDHEGNVLIDTPIWMQEPRKSATDSIMKSAVRIFSMLQVILFSLLIPQRRFSGIRRICLKYIIRFTRSFNQTALLLTD